MPYLVSKYAKNDSLYPKDILTRARIDQRFHFDTAIIFGGAITSFVVTNVNDAESKFKVIEKKYFPENDSLWRKIRNSSRINRVNTQGIRLHRKASQR